MVWTVNCKINTNMETYMECEVRRRNNKDEKNHDDVKGRNPNDDETQRDGKHNE